MERDLDETEERGAQPVEPAPLRPAEGEAPVEGLLRRSLAGLVRAERVEINQGGALVVVAGDARAEKSASVIAVARNLSVRQGGSQWLLAGEARLEQSGSGIMISPRVEAPNARVGMMVAGDVHGNLQVGVLLSRNVEGNVQALMDAAAATRFGIAFGAVLGVALLLRRLLGGRG